MERVFTKLGFKVPEPLTDLKGAEIVPKLRDIRDKDIPNDVGCFVLFVMSHGDCLRQRDIKDDDIPCHGIVYGTDGKRIKIADIIKEFAGDSCKKLVGKPKVFFIHACQGKTDDPGVQSENLKQEGKGIKKSLPLFPTEADILVAFATTLGRTAFRHTTKGAWFIQDLVNALENHSSEYDLVSILTEVNSRVAGRVGELEDEGEYKQVKEMPCFSSHLRKRLHFR